MKKRKTKSHIEIVCMLLCASGRVDAFVVMYYWRIMRLASIIHRLRSRGWKIHTEMKENAKKNGQHAVYKLISKPKQLKAK